MSIQFDPNKPGKEKKQPAWATYIPDRSPKFKVHNSRGPALNALQYKRDYVLYKHNGQEWDEVVRVEAGYNPKCENCGKEGRYNTVRPRWLRLGYGYRSAIHEPLTILLACPDCYRDACEKAEYTAKAAL